MCIKSDNYINWKWRFIWLSCKLNLGVLIHWPPYHYFPLQYFTVNVLSVTSHVPMYSNPIVHTYFPHSLCLDHISVFGFVFISSRVVRAAWQQDWWLKRLLWCECGSIQFCQKHLHHMTNGDDNTIWVGERLLPLGRLPAAKTQHIMNNMQIIPRWVLSGSKRHPRYIQTEQS